MIRKVDKSLIEVREMKDAAWKAFKESVFTSYAEYKNELVKDIRIKFNIKYAIDIEKGENNLVEA